MSEGSIVDRTPEPVTAARLVADLRGLGPDLEGEVVLVHSSLSRIGWVAGGEQAVVDALRTVVGPTGTLVMPAHSGLTDPARWANPPVPESWWPVLYEHLPAFDPATTPSRGMGAIAECFRHVPGVRRSYHPSVSFAALGPHAGLITSEHSLEDGLGERSPLARIYDLDGWVLLLGVGHANDTSLHLAEYRCGGLGIERIEQGSPVLVDGVRRWVTYSELDGNTEDFEEVGADFREQVVGPVGFGEARLMRQRALVDFAVVWFSATRAPVPR